MQVAFPEASPTNAFQPDVFMGYRRVMCYEYAMLLRLKPGHSYEVLLSDQPFEGAVTVDPAYDCKAWITFPGKDPELLDVYPIVERTAAKFGGTYYAKFKEEQPL